MFFLKAFLYLMCTLLIAWCLIFFGGASIIKWSISHYSDGRATPSKVTLSPKFQINIDRLDYKFDGQGSSIPIFGFSRSVKLNWSLFGQEPLWALKIGPTFFENIGWIDNTKISGVSFKEFETSKIIFDLELETLNLGVLAKLENLKLQGSLKKDALLLEDLYFDFSGLSGENLQTWAVDSVKGTISAIELKKLFIERALSVNFFANDISAVDNNLTMLSANGNLNLKNGIIEFNSHAKNLELLDFPGNAETANAEGIFDTDNFFFDFNVGFQNLSSDKTPAQITSLNLDISRSSNDIYHASIQGLLDFLDLFISNNYVGKLPASEFGSRLVYNSSTYELSKDTQLNFIDKDEIDIEILANLKSKLTQPDFIKKCSFSYCKWPEFNFDYRINFDDEWIEGNSKCLQGPCQRKDISNILLTSNTQQIFNKLSVSKIFSPLVSAYLYSLVLSGEETNDGHTLKFN